MDFGSKSQCVVVKKKHVHQLGRRPFFKTFSEWMSQFDAPKIKGLSKVRWWHSFSGILEITKCFLRLWCDIYTLVWDPNRQFFLYRMCFPEWVFTLIPSPVFYKYFGVLNIHVYIYIYFHFLNLFPCPETFGWACGGWAACGADGVDVFVFWRIGIRMSNWKGYLRIFSNEYKPWFHWQNLQVSKARFCSQAHVYI